MTSRKKCDILLLARGKEQASDMAEAVQKRERILCDDLPLVICIAFVFDYFWDSALGTVFRFRTVTLVILSVSDRYIFRILYLRGKGEDHDVKISAHTGLKANGNIWI